jgi:D-alanyl-D-alanine carboxypeptidase
MKKLAAGAVLLFLLVGLSLPSGSVAAATPVTSMADDFAAVHWAADGIATFTVSTPAKTLNGTAGVWNWSLSGAQDAILTETNGGIPVPSGYERAVLWVSAEGAPAGALYLRFLKTDGLVEDAPVTTSLNQNGWRFLGTALPEGAAYLTDIVYRKTGGGLESAGLTIENLQFTTRRVASQSIYLLRLGDDTALLDIDGGTRLAAASLVKIMTALVTLEQASSLEQTAVITQATLDTMKKESATVAGFAAGESVSYRDLLYGLLLPSGADCAETLAASVMGTRAEFIACMNDTAARLGLTDTHFVNPTGLTEDAQYSTARDLAVLLKYALNNPEFRQIFTSATWKATPSPKLPSGLSVRNVTLQNILSNLGPKSAGCKTGYTSKAGLCLATWFDTGQAEYILITLGAKGANASFTDDIFLLYPQIATPQPGSATGTEEVAPVVPPAFDPTAITAGDFTYLSGSNRVATAIAISQAGWSSADAVVVAPGDAAHLIDALAVATYAYQLNAPILVTMDKPEEVMLAEIRRLAPQTVVLVGAVTDAVADALREALPAVKIDVLRGADRQATCALINSRLNAPTGTVAVGYNAVADAVSASSWAALNNYRIVIANSDGTLPASATASELSANYIIGGPTLVKDRADWTRFYGADRYATNRDLRSALSFSYEVLYTADGATLVDALSGSVLAARTGSPIILLPGNQPAGADLGAITADTRLYGLGGVK